MFSGRRLLVLGLGLSLCLTTLAATAAGLLRPGIDFPLPVDSYHDQQIPSLFGKLSGRIQREPLNLVATIIFSAAIIHTFLAARFRKIAYRYQKRYEAIEDLLHTTDDLPDSGKKQDKLIFRAQLFYFPTTDRRWLMFARYTQPEKDHRLLLAQLALQLRRSDPPALLPKEN
jgi:hypothetical protein